MADAEVSESMPAPKPKAVPKAPVKVKKAPAKASKKVVAKAEKKVAAPEATAKTSALWTHENELTAQDDADKILEEGDEEAHEKIKEIHEKEESVVAPARVHLVSEEEAAAAKKDKASLLDSVRNVVQDIKDVKQYKIDEAKHQAEVEKEEEEEAEEKKKMVAKNNSTKASKPEPTKKKINLDKLMNLAKVAKANALGNPKTQLMQEEGDAPTTTGIAAKAFKGPSTKAEVRDNTLVLHNKMAQHMASMNAALHENVKSQQEAEQYEKNKAAMATKEAAEKAKAQAEAEAQKKKEQSEKYQAALKVSAEKAKVEADARAVAKAKVADYRAAQRKLREAKPEESKVLVKPEVAVQVPEMKSSAWASGFGFAMLAVVAVGF
eukprot:gnl/MRDRNA2_/MRDRNA2_88001_c0_seq1.p1 gnl/MRDRNA2_/MRDRNA2_88001_c0~~gnl/MRDRNA2_/MRDRNA2_88001_c0_seq1.p1  ORF type:complete len:429 (-),score=170.74 gnl/MRDRNA2_/MRDRNA2_88001_c0_seq1:15-1151(-)